MSRLFFFNMLVLISSLSLVSSAVKECKDGVCMSNQGESVGKVRSSAEVAFSQGNIDEALKLWAKVIGLEPNNADNYYKRFRVYLRNQKLKEALADLSSALNIKPDYEQVLAQRAKLQLRMGRCEDAENDFLKLQK
jgi:tetratricopeptide (TPR) repeat protein